MKVNSVLPVFNITNFDDYANNIKFNKDFYIRNFNEHVNENLFIEKPHGHDFYLILLVTEGSGKHTIDFKEYDVFPGTLFIVSPGQIHHWDLSNDINGYILFFTKEYFLNDFNSDKLSRFPLFNSTSSLPVIHLNEQETKKIRLSYRLIECEYKNRRLNYQEMICTYLHGMFILISRVYFKNKEKGPIYNYDLQQLNKYQELVDTYYKRHRPISCYAKRMNISERQLSYLCKKTINKTPLEILTDRIILEAKRLIINSNLSISSIASELNYKDDSYFIRLFKKYTQQTPEQFRAAQYGGHGKRCC